MMVSKAIYLTICEFCFLLTQKDIRGLVMFEDIKEYVPEDLEIAQGVFSLVEKGVLTAAAEGCYVLSEYIKTALDILEDARSTFVISGHLSSCPMQCFYFGEGLCLILQMDDYREGVLRIEVSGRTDAVNGLLAYEFMPDVDEFQVDGLQYETKKKALDIAGKAGDDDLLCDESVLLVIDQYQRDSEKPDQRVVVFSDDERYFLTVRTGNGQHTELFDSELFTSLFVEA